VTERAPDLSELSRALSAEEPETRRLAARALCGAAALEAAPLLVRALGDADWRVRKEAVAAAAALSPRAPVLDVLASALDKKDDIGLRNAAVEALRAIGLAALPVAERAFASLDADGRKLAVEVLAGIEDAAVTGTLARALLDEDENVRIAGAEALARTTSARAAATELLLGALAKNPSVDLRLACLRSLDTIGAVLSLEELEPHAADPVTKPAAVRLFARVPAPRATLLCATALGDSSRTVVREAARSLAARIPQCAPQELEIVSKTLAPATEALARLRGMASDDADPTVRSGALLALGLVRDPDDASRFVDALADDTIAEAAELALRLYGQNDAHALLTATKTASPPARGAAISMVPQVTRDGDALAVLRDALSAEEHDVVIAALRSLAQVGQSDDLARAASLASHENASVSIAAAHALAALTEKWPEEASKQWARVRDDEEATLAGCVLAACIGRTSGDNSAPDQTDEDARVAYLVRGAGHPDARLRSVAIEGLGGFGASTDAKAAVTFAVADEEPSAALSAVRSLAALGDFEALERVIHRSKDASLVNAAYDALTRISRAEAALQALTLRLARETDETMRAAISFTLARAESDA
jgi:HEAT repeat protein